MENIGHVTLETMAFAKWYNKWLLTLMKKYLGKHVLDVGAGIGNFTDLLSSYSRVTAIDIEGKYLKLLSKKNNPNISTGFGDIEKGSYFFNTKHIRKTIQFDSVVCLNVLEHIKDDEMGLKNMASLLKSGGHLVLLVPAHQTLFSNFDKNLGHYRRYSKNEVRDKIVQAGLLPQNVRYLNWWAAIGWLVFMKTLKSDELPKPPVVIFDILGKIFLMPEKIISFPFGLSVLAIARKK